MNRKMLIVDDEQNILTTLKRTFSAEGWEIVTASNASGALAVLKDVSNISLILLDMKMPGMDGLELLKHIRNLSLRVPVVIMTAYGTLPNAVEAMKSGAIDFVQKPFSPTEIRAVVESVANRQKLGDVGVVDVPSGLSLARQAILSQEYDRALDILLKTSRINPISAEVFNLMGVIKEYQGQVSEAQKDYRAALSFSPGYKPAQDNLYRTAKFFEYSRENIDLGD